MTISLHVGADNSGGKYPATPAITRNGKNIFQFKNGWVLYIDANWSFPWSHIGWQWIYDRTQVTAQLPVVGFHWYRYYHPLFLWWDHFIIVITRNGLNVLHLVTVSRIRWSYKKNRKISIYRNPKNDEHMMKGRSNTCRSCSRMSWHWETLLKLIETLQRWDVT